MGYTRLARLLPRCSWAWFRAPGPHALCVVCAPHRRGAPHSAASKPCARCARTFGDRAIQSARKRRRGAASTTGLLGVAAPRAGLPQGSRATSRASIAADGASRRTDRTSPYVWRRGAGNLLCCARAPPLYVRFWGFRVKGTYIFGVFGSRSHMTIPHTRFVNTNSEGISIPQIPFLYRQHGASVPQHRRTIATRAVDVNH